MKDVATLAIFIITVVIIAGVVLLYNSVGLAMLWRF
jgi:hypothetical protein